MTATMTATLLLVPFAGGSLGKNPGAVIAPRALIEQLKQKTGSERGQPLQPFTEKIVPVDPSNFSTTQDAIQRIATEGFTIALGGDHSITAPLIRALVKNSSPRQQGLIVFDSHPDTMHPFNPVTHEDYLRTLIEEGTLLPENVLLVGLRAVDPEESRYLKEKHIKTYPMSELGREGVMEVCDAIMGAAKNWERVHVSIDIDALDPAYATGTGYPEPGGLTTRELLTMIQRIKLLPNTITWDIVEIDGNDETTVRVGTTLLAELLEVKMVRR